LLSDYLDSTSNPVNDPLMSLATIRNEIEKLDPAEKASLIDLLWESLDDHSIQKVEAKWAAESEDRIDAFERGELPAVDGPSALAETALVVEEMTKYRFTSSVIRGGGES
jgi:hypothetical protein